MTDRRAHDALLACVGDEDAEDRMTLIVAAGARADAPLPEAVSAAILAGDACLKALRTWRGLTQSELAARAGVNQVYISEIENRSETGAADAMSKLAEVLDVPAGWLG